MAWFRTSVSRCARIRARVAACARREDGELLIEVLFSAMLVALISAAILNGYAGIAHLSGDQRKRGEANALAEQDQERLRGLTITQLAGTGAGTGNYAYTQTIDGTTYTITSASQYITGSSAGSSCATGPTISSADEVSTSSTVSWLSGTTANDNRNPVVIHGLVTPSEGGSLVVTATTGATGASGLAGVTSTVSGGPTTVSPLTTDGNGCAIFGGLSGGSYTVAFTPPAGYIDVNGNTTVANQMQTVVPTSTAHVSVGPLAAPGGINASFSSTYNGHTYSNQSDQFIAVNQGMTPSNRTYGTDSTATNNVFQSTIGTGNVLFPFSTPYTVYAGGCTANQPPAGNQVSAAVTAANVGNGGSPTPVTIPEPAMIILPYSQTSQQTPSYTNFTDDQTNAIVSTTGTWTTKTHSGAGQDYGTTDLESNDTTSPVGSLTIALPANTTSVTVLGTFQSTNGYANITLNGASQPPLDMYSSSTTYGQTVYQNTSLTPTANNTVVISVSGTKGAGNGKFISVDEIKYTTVSYTTTYTQALMTTAPDIIVTDTDSGCGNNKDYPPEQVPTATQGALAFPGLPYGNYSVCVDDGSNHVTQTVANTNFTTGTTVTADIYPGGTGYGTGVCT